MAQQSYSCTKCGGAEYRVGEIRTTGSGITRFLNIQNQKYNTIACTGCGYTELYRLGSGRLGNIFDFFTN